MNWNTLKKTYISSLNLIQSRFIVLIPAFCHVLCIGKSEGYVLSKLAESRSSPFLWHPGNMISWTLINGWVDTADDLKRDYLQFEKRVMLSTVFAKTFFNRCKLQVRVQTSRYTECSCQQLHYTLKFSNAVTILSCSWHRIKQGSCSRSQG